ncbi:MAG: hypothetical protein HY718_14490 [Planctomycetes bacterium]|nr:hypothetical protein [Planctomycetota bacterium]
MRIGHCIGLVLSTLMVAAIARAAALTSAPSIGTSPSPVVRAAILSEPGMPIKGTASAPEVLARILREAGVASELLSADQIADDATLSPSRFDLLVVPTGESFPTKAREAVVRFLHGGGDLIAMGGYAFNDLLAYNSGRWESEADRARRLLEFAMRSEANLLADGGLESSAPATEPTATAPASRWSCSNAERCQIVEDQPHGGRSCARVDVQPGSPHLGPIFWQDVSAKADTRYRISGWMRSHQVRDTGMAFVAAYQYDAGGKLVTFRDFAVARGNTNWTQYQYVFTTSPGVTRLHVKFGLYEANGTAWFDDLHLAEVQGAGAEPMNTSTGRPEDGLVTRPEQIGMFDASFPLKRARRIRTAAGQRIVSAPLDLREPLTGWAASGVTSNQARWVPFLETYDRYDRPRGAGGAMLLHYGGHYAGSAWAYFGIDNLDLFAQAGGPPARALQQVARFLVRGTFLRNLTTESRLYRDGEAIRVTVVVDNRGKAPRDCSIRFAITVPDSTAVLATSTQGAVVQPGKTASVDVTFPEFRGPGDLYRLTAELSLDGEAIDELTTGFVMDRPAVVAAGPQLRFRDNYFTLNGRPIFLFGSDTTATAYRSPSENPLTWSRDHLAARDMGMNLYENLQLYLELERAAYAFADNDWQAFRAMGQLTQKHGLVFMPGMLIGQNVAIGDELLTSESAICRKYAELLHELPGLLYYINGDYQMMPDKFPADVRTLWNRWLTERYGTTERLREAWGQVAVTAKLGSLAFWPPNSGRWDDVAAVDRLRFQTWLTRRWNEAHVAAIRPVDSRHAITSEYYQFGWAGMDLLQTIDGQDVSNFGFFDRPEVDLDILPLKIRYNDLRARGKGVALGEYGVKTHPAWTIDSGADHYHIRRSEEQQAQLFMAVAHYALGMGACKIQNWCLRDFDSSVFPWGIFYPNEWIPKDVAFVHRNQSLIWRHLTPRYVAPGLTLCIPNNLRLGNHEMVGRQVADQANATLLGLHADFNVIDDHHLDALPAATRVMVYPAPFSIDDEAWQRLAAWVKAGGKLLVTGDVSYDGDRQRTRVARLTELAGVELAATIYPDIQRPGEFNTSTKFTIGDLAAMPASPCIKIKPVGAEVLGRTGDGDPVFLRNMVEAGQVYLFTDPTELAADEAAVATRRAVYGAFLRAAGVRPLALQPEEPWLHVFAQPTQSGMVHMLFNTRKTGGQPVTVATAAGEVQLEVRARYPAMAAVTSEGRVVALTTDGVAKTGGQGIVQGKGLKGLLSLDGADLRRSQAVLVAPFEAGTLSLPARDPASIAIVGDFRDGRWTELERANLEASRGQLKIDADRATCLILVCPPDNEPRWAEHLTQAMLRPDSIGGY